MPRVVAQCPATYEAFMLSDKEVLLSLDRVEEEMLHITVHVTVHDSLSSLVLLNTCKRLVGTIMALTLHLINKSVGRNDNSSMR